MDFTRFKGSSLRTRIILSVGVIIFIVLGTSTFVHIRDLRRNYLEAIEWRAEALAQGILNNIMNLQRYSPDYYKNNPGMLSGFSHQITQLYDLNKEKNVAYVGIINIAGEIVGHNDQTLWNTAVESPGLLEHLEQPTLSTVLDGDTYHTLVPIIWGEDIHLGSIAVGFPQRVVEQKVNELLLHSAELFVLYLILTILTISVLMHIVITKPVRSLVTMGQQLAEGIPVQITASGTQGGEIAALQTVFNLIAAYFQHVAEVASQIMHGVLDSDIHVRSEHDILGRTLQDMLQYLRHIAKMASKVAEGDLTKHIQMRSKNDMFGRAIESMTDGLRSLICKIRNSTEQIVATGATIASLASQDISIVKQVNSSAERMMSTMREIGSSVEETAQNMETLSAAVEETSASVAHMANSIEQIASKAAELKRQMYQTVESRGETLKALEDVVQNTDKSQKLSQETIQDALEGQQSVEHVMRSMEQLQQTISSAVEAITDFARRSQDIDRILDVIREIADQTQLLALNASIIAAQAGVHGRGFAVVADEIKNLAGGVTSSTKDIAEIVHGLQRDITSVVQTIHAGAAHVEQSAKQTQQARETLQKINTSTQRSSHVVTEITDALHKLRITSQNVTTAMSHVETMTEDITMATSEHQSSASQINVAIEHVNEMASQIQQATVQQTTGIQNVLNATLDVTKLMDRNLESSQDIADTTEELTSQANLLLQEVERFKLET